VVLLSGAVTRLFGLPASEVAERHVDLGALLGDDAARFQARLEEAPTLETLEAWLAARLAPSRAPAGLDMAIMRLSRGDAVAEVAAAVGRSPRTLRLWFDEAVGPAPATWRAVRRVRRTMDLAAREPDGARLAARAGYADQGHLCREFKAVAGIPLSAWRLHRPGEPSHVREPVADSSKRADRRPR
jgi:AraC-like DNA-binding protein